MFNDSELRRIETTLTHIERDLQELEKAEILIRKHAEDRMESIKREMDRELERNHRQRQDKSRELNKVREDRTHRQDHLQEEFNKGSKH